MATGDPLQVEFTTPGTYEWKVPEGVTSVCVVCVGGGGGGGDANNKSGAGGGGLGWKNNISVNPGQTYTVVVGRGGTSRDSGLDSYFIDDTICAGRGGQWSTTGGAGGSYVGDGGGNGGAGASTSDYSGGGGAGGYSGNGGAGATGRNSRGSSGSGGGGGGGGTYWAGSGGGVGLLRQGINGVGGDGSANIATNGGYGGSGGQHGSRYSANTPEENQASEGGGLYGGGGGSNQTVARRAGGSGAVRIIWGTGRAFPSTNTEDLFIESALQDSDIFLVTKADGSESRHIRADKLFSGIADDWLVLINEGGVSKRCLVSELADKATDARYMLVNSYPDITPQIGPIKDVGVTTGIDYADYIVPWDLVNDRIYTGSFGPASQLDKKGAFDGSESTAYFVYKDGHDMSLRFIPPEPIKVTGLIEVLGGVYKSADTAQLLINGVVILEARSHDLNPVWFSTPYKGLIENFELRQKNVLAGADSSRRASINAIKIDNQYLISDQQVTYLEFNDSTDFDKFRYNDPINECDAVGTLLDATGAVGAVLPDDNRITLLKEDPTWTAGNYVQGRTQNDTSGTASKSYKIKSSTVVDKYGTVDLGPPVIWSDYSWSRVVSNNQLRRPNNGSGYSCCYGNVFDGTMPEDLDWQTSPPPTYTGWKDYVGVTWLFEIPSEVNLYARTLRVHVGFSGVNGVGKIYVNGQLKVTNHRAVDDWGKWTPTITVDDVITKIECIDDNSNSSKRFGVYGVEVNGVLLVDGASVPATISDAEVATLMTRNVEEPDTSDIPEGDNNAEVVETIEDSSY